MNKDTYYKIKNNPFYKPSLKQIQEMHEFEKEQRTPMKVIGRPELHSQSLPLTDR